MKKTIILTILMCILSLCLAAADPVVDTPLFQQARSRMVEEQIRKRGVTDTKTLQAMMRVPRHVFVPPSLHHQAYEDHPLPIGEGQTISQPYIVALMTESLQLRESDTVLEIGTGSGYQAAVLAEIVRKVTTIEIKEKLFDRAARLLAALNYPNITAIRGDGYDGWEKGGPYDGIMITAAVDHIPPPLWRQLKNGGRLILPLGNPFSYQHLVLVTRSGNDFAVRQITGVLFVPMTGQALERRSQ